MDAILHLPFWIAVGQIILIDILLGGDNAVVIALAVRKLPPKQRTQGIIWGTAGAILLRVILIFFALTLLAIPYLKIVGALLLVWIGVKLIAPAVPHRMPWVRCLGGSLRQASAMTTALSPPSRMSIRMIWPTATQNSGVMNCSMGGGSCGGRETTGKSASVGGQRVAAGSWNYASRH